MHPILFKIGSLSIGTYGVAIVAGMIGALWLMGRLARRRALPPEFFYDLVFVLLVCGFAGARLLHIVQNWHAFTAAPLAMLFSRQGFVFQGGFVAAVAGGVVFTRWRRAPFWTVADIAAPALALAHAFGRVGCFFAGCCYGRVCTDHGGLLHALAVRYPAHLEGGRLSPFNFAYFGQMERGLLDPGAPSTLPMIPVQLLESAGNVLLCLALLWAWRRRRFSGQIFALYMALYSALRFGLEFLRGDVERGIYLGLPTGQWIALGTLAAAAALWLTRRGRGVEAVLDDAPPQRTPPSSPPNKPSQPAGAGASKQDLY